MEVQSPAQTRSETRFFVTGTSKSRKVFGPATVYFAAALLALTADNLRLSGADLRPSNVRASQEPIL